MPISESGTVHVHVAPVLLLEKKVLGGLWEFGFDNDHDTL